MQTLEDYLKNTHQKEDEENEKEKEKEIIIDPSLISKATIKERENYDKYFSITEKKKKEKKKKERKEEKEDISNKVTFQYDIDFKIEEEKKKEKVDGILDLN